MQPLLKWVGSKRWIASSLSPIIRQHLTKTYFEPFAGAASVFFATQPESAVLCDVVSPLITTYRQIAENPREVWSYSKIYASGGNNEAGFANYRKKLNNLIQSNDDSPQLAALFLYINKAGFNGLWRQNAKGNCNVPFGDHERLKMPSFATLLQASQLLQNTQLINTIENDVLSVIDNSEKGDVVFTDPPYYQTYDGYDGPKEVSAEFQEALASNLQAANKRGVFVIAMNSYTDETLEWYDGFECTAISRQQNVAGTMKGRGEWKQLLATSVV